MVAICTCRRSEELPTVRHQPPPAAPKRRTRQVSGLRSDERPAVQLSIRCFGELFLHEIPCPAFRIQHHGLAVGSRRDKVADDVDTHHLFVHGVCLYVLCIEPDARFGCTHPLQRVDETTRARWRGDLGGGEVADGGAAYGSLCNPNSDMRLTTARASAGTCVEVAEVGRVEPGGVQQIGEQLLVQVITAARRRTRRTRWRRTPPWPGRSNGGSPTRGDRLL